MLRLRIVTPTDKTEAILQALAADDRIVAVSLSRLASLDPVGDVIECLAPRDAVTPFRTRLDAGGLLASGHFTIQEVLAVAGKGVASGDETGRPSIAWEEVEARTQQDSTFTFSFGLLMTLAGLLAAIAILTNNVVLIVGAMIVSPDFGPVAGASVGLVTRQPRRFLASMATLVLGFGLASVAAFVLTAVIQSMGRLPAPYVSGERPVSDFISDPTWSSLLVALIVGIAGVVSLSQARSGGVIGVLVSVTTIPAAANIGVALAVGEPREAFGAAQQLVLNVAGLLFASVICLAVAWRLSRRLRVLRRRTLGYGSRPGKDRSKNEVPG